MLVLLLLLLFVRVRESKERVGKNGFTTHLISMLQACFQPHQVLLNATKVKGLYGVLRHAEQHRAIRK